MRRVATILLLGLPFAAMGGASRFPIDIEQELNGLDVIATAAPGALTVVTLQNKSKVRVDCTGEFAGGLLTPVKRSTRIAPGRNGTLSLRIKDDVARMSVKLVCKPAPEAIAPIANTVSPNSRIQRNVCITVVCMNSGLRAYQ